QLHDITMTSSMTSVKCLSGAKGMHTCSRLTHRRTGLFRLSCGTAVAPRNAKSVFRWAKHRGSDPPPAGWKRPPPADSRVLSEVVVASVDRLQMFDAIDVRARLRKLDPAALLTPLVDGPLAGVVRGECQALVPVTVQQVPEEPGAVADIELRVDQIVELELRPPGPSRDPFRRRGHQLHEPHRPGRGSRCRPELALLVDDRSKKGRIEVVIARVRADDRLVPKRVPHLLEPALRRSLHERDDDGNRRSEDEECAEPSHPEPVSLPITPDTNRSSSASVPSFT